MRAASFFLVNPQAHNEMILDGAWTCIFHEMCQNTLKRSRKVVLMQEVFSNTRQAKLTRESWESQLHRVT